MSLDGSVFFLGVFSETGAEENRSDQCCNSADHVNGAGTGEIVESELGKPALAVPNPAGFDWIDKQRNNTGINAIGNEFLKVEGEKISSPYVINAIGNPDYLKSAVSGKGGGVDYLKELRHDTRVDTSKKIRIDKYDKDITTKYIN